MIEALYGVDFRFNTGSYGYGVVVLETGRILGGDSSFIFIGDYEVNSSVFSARVNVHNDRNILESASGLDKYVLILEGKADSNCKELTLTGHVEGQSSLTATVVLSRRAELP